MRFRALKPHLAPPFLPARRLDDGDVVTLPVPGYRQVRSYSCGFATALMVVRYFELPVAGRELYSLLGTDRTGTRQTAIVRALRGLGLRASVRYDAGFDRLARGIDAGKLVVGYLHDVEHWLVLYGYGRDPDRVFVADPRPGLPCEHLWEDYGARLGGFGIFCSRADRAARAEDDAMPMPMPERPLGEARSAPAGALTQLRFDFDPR